MMTLSLSSMRSHRSILVSAILFSSCVRSIFSFDFFSQAGEAKTEDRLQNDDPGVSYGVDVSSPMHYSKVSTNYPWLPHNVDPENNPIPKEYEGMAIQPLGDKQGFYDELIKGCKKHYGRSGSACLSVESDRIEMNKRQPKSMVNYTENGFKKIRAPPEVYKLVKDFWDANKKKQKPEQWFTGNTYTNHWDSPTHMVSVEDVSLRGGGGKLKQAIWSSAKETMQQWTGEELTQCSLYGVRVYQEGAVLAHHVDRLPLVASAIINVDQDVDEPWPIEVIGHDGKAHNVTMEPGDMVLYESHSVIHGRPFPLKGRFYANLFVHFEPVGHSLRHHGLEFDRKNVNEKYKEDVAKGVAGHENHNGMPSYILEDSDEGRNWKRSHPNAWRPTRNKSAKFATGSSDAHTAAQAGDVEALKKIAAHDKHKLHEKDQNGWQPIHEAARSGAAGALKYLIEEGADVNERTNEGMGGTILYLVVQSLGEDHPVVEYLKSIDAEYIEPEL